MAIRDYSRVIVLEPGNVDAYVNRSLAYSNVGQPGLAVQDMDVVGLTPGYVKAYLVRAYASALLGRNADSQTNLDRAVALGIDRSAAEATIAEATSSR